MVLHILYSVLKLQYALIGKMLIQNVPCRNTKLTSHDIICRFLLQVSFLCVKYEYQIKRPPMEHTPNHMPTRLLSLGKGGGWKDVDTSTFAWNLSFSASELVSLKISLFFQKAVNFLPNRETATPSPIPLCAQMQPTLSLGLSFSGSILTFIMQVNISFYLANSAMYLILNFSTCN